MEKIIKIANKEVGARKPVFIIAEAGVNHNGSLEIAMDMVRVAKDAGADAIKFQTFTAEDVATSDTGLASYAQKHVGAQATMVSMLKKLELRNDDFRALKKYCDEQGIMFLSTPHTSRAVDFLDELAPAFKVASGDITNDPLLQQIAKTGKPILLSTGMATLKEVAEAVNVIRAQGNEQIILLHCTTQYPTEPHDVNLRAMLTLQKEFNLLVGYSDHTLGFDAAKLAVRLGAVVLEKHLTLDKSAHGPDHQASLEPQELKAMVAAIRNNDSTLSEGKELLLGRPKKQPTTQEIAVAEIARKSIVAQRDILKGEIITQDAVTVKRPGTGLSPKFYQRVLGSRAKRNITSDAVLSREDVDLS